MGVLAGLVILLTSLSPGQAQTVDCAPTPTSTPNPGDQEFEEDELPPLAVILAMVFFILLVFLLILLLVVLAGMILVGFILMIVSALVGLSAVIALIRQSWQDGLKALFSQLLLILFTLFGLVLGWLAAGLEINPLPVWAAILLGAVLGLAGGLVTLFSVWGIISWLEKSR
jgi:hypothetical protein